MALAFRKMHALGNDFVIVDARGAADPVTPALTRALGDRHFGVGFDQLAVIHHDPEADARLTFWNADGSPSATCGNATRCVARLLMAEAGAGRATLRTGFGLLAAEDAGDGLTRVNMGAPAFDWRGIPLAREVDPLHLPLPGTPAAVGMGNPHCVFFVADAAGADIAAHGPRFEHDPLFPERTNVEMVEIAAPDHLRLRLWERGVGITLASGSCASAALAAAHRRGLAGARARIDVDGGTLWGDWRGDGLWLTGPTAEVFTAQLTDSFLAALQETEPA